jgi:glycosyltransferase involved in cell wall biosynthesis
MKILLLTPMLPQADGDGAIPVLLYAQLVGLHGRHEVTLVSGMGDEPGELRAAQALIRAGVDLHVADRRQPRRGMARWRRRRQLLSTWARGSWPWRTVWFAAPAVQRVLDKLATTRTFDVVAVEDSAMGVFRLPEAEVSVLTEYEVRWPRPVDWRAGSPTAWPRWALRELDSRRWARFQRATWQRFDRVQVFTERDAEAISVLAPDVARRVRVNPFGLSPSGFVESTQEDPGTALFVGNFTHYPNRDAAMWLAREIMPVVRAASPGARLRIVGTSPPREIRDLANSFVEVIADAERIEDHLELACVVAAPVRVGGGMRMKVLHALAIGKAVVTTTRGAEGYRHEGDEPPFIVADDTASFAAAITKLLADEPLRRELGRRGRQLALEHHSVDAWVARLEAVYEEARNH